MDLATKYARERSAFGKPISSLFAIQQKLSMMACKLDSARLLTWRAAVLKVTTAQDDETCSVILKGE